MAKKKEIIPSYLKDVFKEYGKIVIRGNELLTQRKDLKVVSVSPSIDLALNGGLREGSWLILSGPPKCGKAGPISSLVYTPNGPIKMGDIQLNQEICTPDGQTAQVTGIFPQGIKKVYRITFNDFSYAECDIEHLWKVAKNNRQTNYEVLSLKDIMYQGLYYSDRPKWKVQLTEPVFFTEKTQDIPPYILGCLLGDGGFTNGSPTITSTDNEIIEIFKDYAKSINLKCNYISKYDYRLSNLENKIGDNTLTNKLRELGLMKKNSHEKFIPENYKYGSIKQRFLLINGLMDTDGHNINGKGAEYSTVSKKLALDIKEVIQSLGYTVKFKYRFTKCNGRKFPSYRLYIAGNNIDLLFSLSRKKSGHIRSKSNLFRTIRSIEYVRDEECQCIAINHPDKLYLTDNFIPTHNTTLLMQLAKNCQDENRPVIYCNTEGRLNELNFEVEGIDPNKMEIITAEEKPIPAEVFLQILYQKITLPEYEGALCIIDSVSSLIPKKDLEGEVSGTTRPGLPKILSDFVKKTGQVVPHTKTIMCLITHMITNTSGFGKTMNPDGGVKIQFQSDTRMEATSVKSWEVGEKKIGQSVNWKIYYSGLGAKSYDCQNWIRYGKGIDKVQEIIIIAQELGIISKSGAWYTCDFLLSNSELFKKTFPDIEYNAENSEEMVKACKFQGTEKLHIFFTENDFLVKELTKEVMDMLV